MLGLVLAACLIGGFAAPAPAGGEAPAAAARAPWSDLVKDRLRGAHTRMRVMTASIEDPIRVEEALRIVGDDYLSAGFLPMTEAELATARAEVDELFCLLTDAPSDVDPFEVQRFLAISEIMYLDLGGQLADLGC